jgi:hypothetical protein
MTELAAEFVASRRQPARLRKEPPLRRCIATGESRPQHALLRFVVGPDGTLVPDLAARLPGRGLWLSPQRDIIARACSRNLFAKAAKASVKVPEDLLERVEELLRRRCLEQLGLAMRVGQAVCGHDKVAARIAEGKTALLIQAEDAAEGGRRKLRERARRQGKDVAVIEIFDAETLGRALGREACVHVAVAPGRMAAALAADLARLTAVCGRAAWDLEQEQLSRGLGR